MITITALKGAKPMSKTIVSPTETESYPLLKSFTSTEHTVDPEDIEQLYDVIKSVIADKGCIIKGNLKKKLKNESRAGHSDRFADTRWVCIDVDNLTTPGVQFTKPIDQSQVIKAAKKVIAELPSCFHDASYVAQASTKLGLKGNCVSMHIFFMLASPIEPKELKKLIKKINFESDMLKDSLRLNASGHSLSWPIDPSVADNSKVIYVTPPVIKDPSCNVFASPDDRLVYVKQKEGTVDVLEHDWISDEKFVEAQSKQVRLLRSAEGMPRRTAKFTTKRSNGENVDVLDNPERCKIEIVDDQYFPFIRCNVNGGDSGAYYIVATDPEFIRNFKDEPIFSVKKAAPQFYEDFIDQYGDRLEEERTGDRPVAFRDHHTSRHFAARYDSDNNTFLEDFPLSKINKVDIEDFMANYGAAVPVPIPEGTIMFDPTVDGPTIQLDKPPFYINNYMRSSYVLKPKDVPSHNIKTWAGMSTHCPNIHSILHHALGSDDESAARFLNWLSYVYQTRKKTGVSWVFSGTQGTGKGVFFSRVLKPIFTDQHAPLFTLDTIEDQFNGRLSQAIIAGIDEFRIGNARSGTSSRVADRLKNMITEKKLNIRRMQQESVEERSYTNFIFFSNAPDAVKIERGDRRFNVAKPQQTPLIKEFPKMVFMLDKIDKELSAFSGYLKSFKVDHKLATTAWENRWKHQMRAATMNQEDEFIEAVKSGDLAFFEDVLNTSADGVFNGSQIVEAKNLVRQIAVNAKDGNRTVLNGGEWFTIYQVTLGADAHFRNVRSLSKAFRDRAGLDVKRRLKDADGSIKRGVGIHPKDMQVVDDILDEDDQRKIA